MTAWKEKIEAIIHQQYDDAKEIKLRLQELLLEQEQEPLMHFKQLYEVENNMKRWMTGLNDKVIFIGFDIIDRFLGGFGKGEITVIAGRPGMGSSRMMHHIILHCAEKHRCLLLNFENAPEKTWFDLLSYQLDKDYDILTNHNGSNEIFTEAFRQKHAQKIANISIGENYLPDLDAFERQLKAYIQANHVEVLGIDKVQLMCNNNKFRQRNQVLSKVMLLLNRVAKECQVCIFLISEVDRNVERRDFKVPHLTDLSDSNAIHEYADKVLFLYRRDYYAIYDVDCEKEDNLIEVHLAKNKYGSCFRFVLKFYPVLK